MNQSSLRCLLVGNGMREVAIFRALCRGGCTPYVLAGGYNPELASKATQFRLADMKDTEAAARWAVEQGIGFAVIGPEDPLSAGLVDALAELGIPSVGPRRSAAQVETSKLFLRDLMKVCGIEGQVEYHLFRQPDDAERFILNANGREYAIKPIGLTSGKGVKVMGVQLHSPREAALYARQVIEQSIGGDRAVLIEERLLGKEFTLQVFVDGETLVPMPLVRDYKPAYEGDQGPNTGSMGSYSQADGLLPFVDAKARRTALTILEQIVSSLRARGITYRGVLYGQFCMSEYGPKLIETNARFGDPEAVNVLTLLQSSFIAICQAIIAGRLGEKDVRFAKKATVCKYVTPPGYPERSVVGAKISFDRQAFESMGVDILPAQVEAVASQDNVYLTTKSRSFALVASGNTVAEASELIENALAHVQGEYHLRHDIGNEAV